MLTVAHVGVGGVKNGLKHAHVINGRPPIQKVWFRHMQIKKLKEWRLPNFIEFLANVSSTLLFVK